MQRKNSFRRNSFTGALDRIVQGAGLTQKDRNSNKCILLKAKESYEAMIENRKLGELCVVEKCFVFTGITEQSLMLCALKQVSINFYICSF